MIDLRNEIFTLLYNTVIAQYPSCEIKGEYMEQPAKFPCVTMDEISNIPSNVDSGTQDFSDVTYRVQIFSNAKNKQAQARAIFKLIDDLFYSYNIIGQNSTSIPTVYNSAVYEIQATYKATINSNGVIFRR